MQLSIRHTTNYSYDKPVVYSLLQIRLTPKQRSYIEVLDWDIQVTGGKLEASFTDQHHNTVSLVRVEKDTDTIELVAQGAVDIGDTAGVAGAQNGFAPLWYFKRETARTHQGPLLRKLVKTVDDDTLDPIPRLHALSQAIAEAVEYQAGATHENTTSEEALSQGKGVCQDHAHVFLAAARHLQFPARYVSGYLMMNDRIDQDATHAWAEVYVEPLGWVGFDVSNGISPDARYVPLATGLDYHEAAPIRGVRLGDANEHMRVTLQVQQ